MLALSMPLTFGQETPQKTEIGKPVTVRLKIVPIKTALAEISKQSAVSLDVATAVESLKVTIFTEKEPVEKVMAGIAGALDLAWKKTSTGYILAFDADSKEAIRRYEMKQASSLKNKITSLLSVASQNIPSRQNRPIDFGSGAGQFSPQQLDGFINGDLMTNVNTIPISNNSESIRASNGRRWRGQNNNYMTVLSAAKYSPGLGKIDLLVYRNGESQVISPGLAMMDSPPDGYAATLEKWWLLPTDDATLLKAFKTQPSLTTSIWPDGQRSFADHLESLFDATKLPIYSDAFRYPSKNKRNYPGTNVGQWLDNFAQTEHAWVHFENGSIMVRHPEFWQLRHREIPELLLSQIETKSAKGLSLDDYANFASKLTSDQMKSFSGGIDCLTKFNKVPLQKSLPLLVFYGNLSASQRQQALNGGAVMQSQMSENQRRLYMVCLLNGMFERAPLSGSLRNVLNRPDVLTGNTALGFSMKKDGTVEPGYGDSQFYNLVFGVSERDCMLLRLSIPRSDGTK